MKKSHLALALVAALALAAPAQAKFTAAGAKPMQDHQQFAKAKKSSGKKSGKSHKA